MPTLAKTFAALIVLATLAAGFYYFSADIANFNGKTQKTYVNRQYEFQLSYPSELFLNTFRTERGEVVRIAFSPEPERASDSNGFGTFTILIDTAHQLEEILTEYRQDAIDTLKTENTFVNGTPAIRGTYRSSFAGDTESPILIAKDGRVFVMEYRGDEEQERVFKDIISSVKFIELRTK